MSTEPLNEETFADFLLAPQTPPEAEHDDAEAAEETITITATDEVEEVTEEHEAEEAEYDSNEIETEHAEEQDAEPEEQLFTVKVDGQEQSVTLEELRRGYSGQAKIQLGMQQAAQARKQAQEIEARMAQHEQHLTALIQNLNENGQLTQPTPPSAELARTDPYQYNIEQAEYTEAVGRWQQQQMLIQQTQQSNQQKREFERQQLIQREAARAAELIPELADAKRAPAVKKQLAEFGQSVLQFNVDELANVSDARALYAMHLARIGYEALQGKQKAQQKTQKAKPVLKAGAKKTQDPKRAAARKARDNVRKSGSADAFADWLLN